MKDHRDESLSSYDYQLDSDLIAQFPLEPRHSARLLIVENFGESISSLRHAKVLDLQNEIRPGDLLVLNDTRVLKARLRVRRGGGGLSELLMLEPLGEGRWLCLGRPAKRMRPGEKVWLEAFNQESICLKILSKDLSSGGRVVQFPPCFSDRESIEPLLNIYGEVPLPPYINNHYGNGDRYQTCYADKPGAVAAPTAGLHLSDQLLNLFREKGVNQTMVTLHVGLGTFRPVEKEDLRELKLHSEWVEVGTDAVSAVKACKANGGRVIAVGTTSVRALEGAFNAGARELKPFAGNVDLVIKPGYQFGVIDGLLTNFHLPKSSLMLLVSALLGRERLLALYSKAIEHQYRFFSYGDAMWINPEAVLPEARP